MCVSEQTHYATESLIKVIFLCLGITRRLMMKNDDGAAISLTCFCLSSHATHHSLGASFWKIPAFLYSLKENKIALNAKGFQSRDIRVFQERLPVCAHFSQKYSEFPHILRLVVFSHALFLERVCMTPATACLLLQERASHLDSVLGNLK